MSWMWGQPFLAGAVAWLALVPLCCYGQQPITLKVGVAASLTGPLSEWAEAVDGYKLWADAINVNGITIRDQNGTSFKYRFNLTVIDDNSTAEGHAIAVNRLLRDEQVHFMFGGSPAFPNNESTTVQQAGRLIMHCCSSANVVFARDQKAVFAVMADSTGYTEELFKEFRANNIFKIAVVYREDVLETASVCGNIIANARSELLTISTEVKYSGGLNASLNSTVLSLAQQVNASAAEALIMCGLAEESRLMATYIDQLRRPLKARVFTGGFYSRELNEKLGRLSQGIISPAHWAPDVSRSDTFFGDAKQYTNSFKSLYGREPTYIAAAASATGLVLSTVLADTFKRCSIAATGGDPQKLLFTQNAISCADNINLGYERLIAALALVNMETMFGAVDFNRFRVNQGYKPVVLQTFEVTESLKQAFKPTVVLPLGSAQRGLIMPGTNLYAPVCQAGTYRGPDDFEDCIKCPNGQFQEFSGKSNCELCPKDTYANSTATRLCTECPANTETLQRGSEDVSQCSCKVGFYNKLGKAGLACEPCPDNALCVGGLALPSPNKGFYAEKDVPFQMYPCNPASICLGNFTCDAGYRGRLCMYCSEGYYRFLGNCVRCPSQSSNVIGYLLIMYILWVLVNVSFARSVENFMVVINFCQLLSIITGFGLNWPKTLYAVMNFSSVLSFEVDSLEPTCIENGWSFAHNLVVQLMMPFMITGLVLVWIGWTYGLYRLNQMRMTRSIKAALSARFANEATWKQVLHSFLDVPTDKREVMEMLYERFAIPFNFLNIGYLILFKYCLSTFSCTDIMGVKYMTYAPNDQCYTTKHWNLMVLGASGLLVYSFGFVALYAHVIRQLRKYRAFGEKRPLLLFGWMYEKYEAQYYWYEVVILVQRIGFVLVLLFVTDPALQAVLCMVISVAVLLGDIRTSSYVDKSVHAMQATSDGLLAFMCVGGLLFYNPLVTETVVKIMEYILLSAVVMAFGLAVVFVLLAMAMRLLVVWLMSKHRPVAYKLGQRVKAFRFMYQVFGPVFLFRWLRACTPEEWEEWHKLCEQLVEFVHPTSEVAYLSLKKVGRFWRYLLHNFPETIDFLVSVSNEHREHFNNFIEVLYEHFFDTAHEHRYQLHDYVADKYKAAVAQWLSSTSEEERHLMQRLMKQAFLRVKGQEAALELQAAMSRSSRIQVTTTVLSAVGNFKKGLSSLPAAKGDPYSASTLTVKDVGASVADSAQDVKAHSGTTALAGTALKAIAAAVSADGGGKDGLPSTPKTPAALGADTAASQGTPTGQQRQPADPLGHWPQVGGADAVVPLHVPDVAGGTSPRLAARDVASPAALPPDADALSDGVLVRGDSVDSMEELRLAGPPPPALTTPPLLGHALPTPSGRVVSTPQHGTRSATVVGGQMVVPVRSSTSSGLSAGPSPPPASPQARVGGSSFDIVTDHPLTPIDEDPAV